MEYDRMYFDSLRPETRKKILARSKLEGDFGRLEDIANSILKKEVVPESSVYRCHKCKGNRIEIIQNQTRSADEGTTTFYKCSECGHGWRN
jgi:DNA-directed RNA polymerase subunit M/transcription elongation factor TFIIS